MRVLAALIATLTLPSGQWWSATAAGAYAGGRLWELTCGVKEHLLRLDPTTGASTAVGQFAKAANDCDASLTAAGGKAFVLEGRQLYVYG